ncbi:MAG: cation transporter [Legionellales bacterium RIFCSPHIGHO2_12_FULL_37_14]|nr:MAG: cation transporter [Legionellales bacterium RIFCSPHIGHO2_12_FULL_37_14]
MQTQRYQQAKQITLIGALTNSAQGIAKILGGIYCNSHALIADGIHSFSDLLTDFMVIFGSHYGSQDADATHPYGHQRIETASTLFLSLLLALAGLGIAIHTYDEWAHRTLDAPTIGALVIALLSIAFNEALFYSTLHVGKKINSDLVKTNAWHHRADSASALVVSVGIIGSMLGYHYLDAVAALIVAWLIIKMGFVYAWRSLQELIDTAVSPEIIQEIERIITSVAGVNKIHQLRTRTMGSHIIVDVHVLVFPYITVSEGHYIAHHVHQTLLKKMPAINDVTVHIDPEDDEVNPPSAHLPNRKNIEKTWLIPLQANFPQIQTWNLHYLEGKLILDIYLNKMDAHSAKIAEYCQKEFAQEKDIKAIRLFTLAHELKMHTV